MKAISRLMLLPSLACPAGCKYCFGPNRGGSRMHLKTLEAVVRWQRAFNGGNGPVEITFHGGEPLAPGIGFYYKALPLLRKGLASNEVRFGVQSNLWLLTDELCKLFCEYGVSVGTSLDGPEEINDAQRGRGYFQRTMAGIERARAHGLNVGCICTFTAQSAPHAQEVFDFFLSQGLDFSIHAALPALGKKTAPWVLSPEQAGPLLIRLFEQYVENLERIYISTLNAICRSLSARKGGICTFGDCLGNYLAVDPEGWIYPCQRLAGLPAYRLGNVHDCPTRDDLAKAPAWQAFRKREECIAEVCDGCPHIDICRGGCPYNALVACNGRTGDLPRDPYCQAYRQVLDYISEKALAEVFSKENLEEVIKKGPSGRHGLLRKGRVLKLVRGGPHPQKLQSQARRTVAAVALAVCKTVEEAVERLKRAGLVTRPEVARQSLESLWKRLEVPDDRLLNAYLHVTYTCNLNCTHCYALAAPFRSEAMPVNDILQLVEEAACQGFAKIVLTGGEPLLHPKCEALLEGLASLRQKIRPAQTVLRTNLACSLTNRILERLACSTDQIVVSLDGDESAHDARRGVGTYQRTIANLKRLIAAKPSALISIAATLTADEANGQEGEAVRALGEELGLLVRFKPVLPLGRAAQNPLPMDSYTSLEEEGSERLACYPKFAATCGLGMNLYIAPDGDCYPCYALMGACHRMGNILIDGLAAVLARNRSFRRITVDSNQGCRYCALRYLCGGFCRAWGKSDDPNAPPGDCTPLHQRARSLLMAALEALEVSEERWLEAGLPLPAAPPGREER